MKKGIVVASFGTSFPDVRKRCIESIEDAIVKAYPDFEVRRAFTSNMIIKKLKDRDNLNIDTPIQALKKMVDEGIKEIHVQPLHVIPGFEYEKVHKAVKTINHRRDVHVTIGMPLLSKEEHYDQVIDAIAPKLSKEDERAFVLMGHGTEHHANACYSMLQAKLNDRRDDVFISNVEGYPELDHVMPKLEKYKHVTLMPLMIVAGDHAMNDMAGDEDSYKVDLSDQGKEVACILEGLGEIKAIHEIFINRIKECIE
ncbi:sirohydrochlorin cobaltochelatase [Acidaminobacter sp. JC074]|uniref:sirohydrochlorin cobaltochelatase n=1 Tax=Acidaminobacter sp. JC074 TaxID=2530199 RepID=UPI001F0F882D|nr:sirohydrochlorin cobaltochelatase [Acidaminobacter sp. JC074]MCH4889456.1 sirohydrochlorin cobaltochelatase [Acidaminobacter sp. JC074]